MTSSISNDVKSPINAPSASPFRQRQKALEYAERGCCILPVKFAGGTLVTLKQPRSGIGPDNSDQFFPDNHAHIGAATGHASSGLMVVRLPDSDARDLAKKFLPRTAMTFGSPCARREYWVYEINESGADLCSYQWTVSGMNTLAKLHGNGGITALPDYRLGEFESSIPEL